MSRKARREAAARHILATAAKLAARSGPEKLSLREVARESGYSPASLYAYFDSRQALLEALAARESAAMVRALQAKASEGHPLIALGQAYLRFAARHPGRFQLVAVGDDVRAVFIEQVEACVSSGEVMAGPGFDVEEIAATLHATVHGFATLQLPAAVLEEGLRCLIEGLRG